MNDAAFKDRVGRLAGAIIDRVCNDAPGIALAMRVTRHQHDHALMLRVDWSVNLRDLAYGAGGFSGEATPEFGEVKNVDHFDAGDMVDPAATAAQFLISIQAEVKRHIDRPERELMLIREGVGLKGVA